MMLVTLAREPGITGELRDSSPPRSKPMAEMPSSHLGSPWRAATGTGVRWTVPDPWDRATFPLVNPFRRHAPVPRAHPHARSRHGTSGENAVSALGLAVVRAHVHAHARCCARRVTGWIRSPASVSDPRGGDRRAAAGVHCRHLRCALGGVLSGERFPLWRRQPPMPTAIRMPPMS